MKYCEDCGTELLDDDNFCIECGILQEKICTDIINHYCEECGTEIEDDDIFCTECGTLQFCCDNNFCEECGTVLELGNIFCTECGNPFGDYSISSDTLNIDNKQFENEIPNDYPKAKNKNISNIIIKLVIIILIAFIIASAIYLFYIIKENNNTSTYENDITQTTTESTTEVTTEMVKDIDYNVYREILENYQNSGKESEYFFNDLNNDDMYELFVLNGIYDYDSTLNIYTLKNGKVFFIGDISMSNSYICICQNGETYKFYGHMGLGSLTQLILKNDKIEFKEIIPEKEYPNDDAYSDIYEYLELKNEIIYSVAEVEDYSLLEDVINGVKINTKLMSYDDTFSDNNYTKELTTEESTEKTTQKPSTTTTETTTEVVTKKENNIILPDTPLVLTLPGQYSSSESGTVEITDLKIEYSTYMSGYIKNNNDKSIKNLHLAYKVYDEKGVCVDNFYIYENDMSPNEIREISKYFNVSYDKKISKVEFDIESSYIQFRE